MALIDTSYFVGDLDIPNSTNANVIARINWFIDKYEPKFLTLLFGVDLYAEYVTQMAIDPVDEDWQTLSDKLPNLVACYVYYWYMRDAATKSTGLGEVLPAPENGTAVSGGTKMCRAWNEMIEGIAELYDYLDDNTDLFVDWTKYGRYGSYPTFAPINAFNL